MAQTKFAWLCRSNPSGVSVPLTLRNVGSPGNCRVRIIALDHRSDQRNTGSGACRLAGIWASNSLTNPVRSADSSVNSGSHCMGSEGGRKRRNRLFFQVLKAAQGQLHQPLLRTAEPCRSATGTGARSRLLPLERPHQKHRGHWAMSASYCAPCRARRAEASDKKCATTNSLLT